MPIIKSVARMFDMQQLESIAKRIYIPQLKSITDMFNMGQLTSMADKFKMGAISISTSIASFTKGRNASFLGRFYNLLRRYHIDHIEMDDDLGKMILASIYSTLDAPSSYFDNVDVRRWIAVNLTKFLQTYVRK